MAPSKKGGISIEIKDHRFKSLENIKILKSFPSHQNNVYKVEVSIKGEKTLAVIKVYNESLGVLPKLTESKNLLKLRKKGITVPRILKKTEDALFLNFIPGTLVNDLVEKLDLGEWIEKLAEWMARLHQIKKSESSFLKSDLNLRNFILSNGEIYGLDFEETQYGDPREDLGDICYFLLTNYPPITFEKNIMISRFLKAYEEISDQKIQDISIFILKSVKKAQIRREKFLRSYIKK